jgi:tetratricopeptide (TPR) repeat protein
MAELRDDENTAYVELVQELLNYPQGEEQALLATRPELVDENLVMTLLAVAKMLMERDGQEAESTAGWLVGFAQDLAGQLGLDIGGDDDDDCSQDDLDFLNALIEAEQTDKTQVPVLFAQNLQRLTPGLGAIMKWYTQKVVTTRPEDAEGFVALIENIVNRLSEFPLDNRAQNMEIVIAGYEAVLTVRTKENHSEKWAQTQNNLAGSLSNKIRGDKAENMEQSIASYKAALEVRTPQSLPLDCLQTSRNLGTAHFNQGHWQKAIEAYETAMEAAETSRSWSVDDTERQRVLQSALSVYENAIQCAVNLKNYKQAIEYTERIRSRQLVELMHSKDLYHDAQVPAEIQQYLDEYQQLNQKIQNLQEGGEERQLAVKASRSIADL